MADTVSNDVYADLATQIIQKQATILGAPVAVRRARNVTGLEVDDMGKAIRITGSANQVLADLVEQYKSLSGSVGVDFCKQAAVAWSNAHAGVKLPPVLL